MNLASATGPAPAPVRVLIVDDSAIARGMIAKWLVDEAGLDVGGYATDGQQAIDLVRRERFDVCVLDIEMPRLSGLEALPGLLAAQPDLKVIMASTLTERGADVTLRALALGAADFIPKPSTTRMGSADAYRRDLVEKIRWLGRPRALRPAGQTRMDPPPPPLRAGPVPGAYGQSRPQDRGAPLKVLAIASSTGGPQALTAVLRDLGPRWTLPILIVQHMPAEFTPTLAAMLDKICALTVREAAQGEPVVPGRAYVAPGGRHLRVRPGVGGRIVIELDQGPEVNFCRPSADPLFETVAQSFGATAAGLVLTGMGHDGREGARALAAAGAPILVQDEGTSVVWGMPGAVAEAGLADAVLPLNRIASHVTRLFQGGSAKEGLG